MQIAAIAPHSSHGRVQSGGIQKREGFGDLVCVSPIEVSIHDLATRSQSAKVIEVAAIAS